MGAGTLVGGTLIGVGMGTDFCISEGAVATGFGVGRLGVVVGLTAPGTPIAPAVLVPTMLPSLVATTEGTSFPELVLIDVPGL